VQRGGLGLAQHEVGPLPPSGEARAADLRVPVAPPHGIERAFPLGEIVPGGQLAAERCGCGEADLDRLVLAPGLEVLEERDGSGRVAERQAVVAAAEADGEDGAGALALGARDLAGEHLTGLRPIPDIHARHLRADAVVCPLARDRRAVQAPPQELPRHTPSVHRRAAPAAVVVGEAHLREELRELAVADDRVHMRGSGEGRVGEQLAELPLAVQGVADVGLAAAAVGMGVGVVASGEAEAPLGHALGDALNQIGPVLDHGRELVVPGVDEPGEVRVLVHQVQRDLARADVALHVPGPVEVPRPVGVGVGTQVDRFDRHQ